MASASSSKVKKGKAMSELPSNLNSKISKEPTPPELLSKASKLGANATQPETDCDTDIYGESTHCELCDQANADMFCLECKQYLCPGCQKIHLRGTITKEHKVVRAEDLFSVPEEKQVVNQTEANNEKKESRSRKVKVKGGQATYVEQIDIAMPTDKRKPIVSAMEVTEDGGLIVCDSGNQKIKLFDSNYAALSELDLTAKPMGMVLVSSSDLIVSLPDEQCLQKVKIKKGCLLTLENKVKTKLNCYRLLRNQDHILAYAHDDLYRFFNIMDTDGNTIRCIMNEPRDSGNEPIFKNVFYMCLGTDNKNIYATDEQQGCVGISLNGKVDFTYKDVQTKSHHGVCGGADNSVYLACNDSDKIVAIDKKGQKLKDLISVKGIKPAYLFYNKIGKKLFVKRGGTSKVLIYTIT